MLEKITEEELEFMESFYTPECLAECLFNNIDNLSLFDNEKTITIRKGQHPLISTEYILDEDPKLSVKKNMALREGSSNLVCLSARNFGKTALERVDIVLGLLCMDNEPLIASSYDAIHVRGMLNPVIDALNFHPIVSLFRKSIQRTPFYLLSTKNGAILDGINMNVKDGNRAGEQFFQKHAKKMWIEEASKETQAVFNKRVGSRHALGCVERLTGMTDFTPYSPPGKAYYSAVKSGTVMRVPSYINPDRGVKDRETEIERYLGEQSLSFRMYVEAMIVEDAISAIDMERARMQCYPHNKKGFVNEKITIQKFEVDKKHYKAFKNTIVVDRPKNAERIWIASDIGRSSKSEILIFSEVNGIYRLIYNITLHNLIDKEQFEVLKYIAEKLEATFIAVDCGDGLGVAIYGRLEEVFPKENLIWYDGSRKVPIGIEKDDKGDPVIKNGKPVYRELIMAEWSVQHLCKLLYSGKFYLPFDYNLDEQLTSVVAIPRGNRVVYQCIASEDHLFDTMKIFAIAEWMNQFNLLTPIKKKKRSVGAVSWEKKKELGENK